MANGQTTPHVSCDEDARLAGLARTGDDHAFAVLVARMEPMLRAQAAKFRSSGVDAEDLAQEGLLGLLAAVRTYSPQKGASFRTYATVCVRHRLISAARRFGHAGEVPMEEVLSVPQVQSDPAVILAEKDAVSQLLLGVARVLSQREYQTLLRHLNGESYADIAAAMQVAPKSVDNALQRARAKLQSSQFSKNG